MASSQIGSAAVVAADRVSTKPKRSFLSREQWLAIAIVSPSIIAVAVFVYGFIAWSLRVSLSAWESGLVADYTFVGLRQYTALFVDPRFQVDVVNTLIFTVLFVAVALVMGLVLAMLLDQKVRGEAFFRSVFLFPMAVSFIVTGVAWRWLMNPAGGSRISGINLIFQALGLDFLISQWHLSKPVTINLITLAISLLGFIIVFALLFAALAWLIRTLIDTPRGERFLLAGLLKNQIFQLLAVLIATSLFWNWLIGVTGGISKLFGLDTVAAGPLTHMTIPVGIAFVVIPAVWQMSGFTMAMYLGGLRSIPEDLREAARVDGADEVQIFRYIILPLLQPVTLSAVIVLGHISLKIFDLIVAVAQNNQQLDVPSVNMWRTTFDAHNYAKGAAIGILMLITVAVLIIPYLIYSMRTETEL